MIRKFMLTALAAVTLGSGLALVEAPAQAAGTMSQTRAGQYYLRQMCKANHAGDRFVRIVWGNQDRISLAEVRRQFPTIKQASRRYGLVEHEVARALYNPPGAWPSMVAPHVRTMASLSTRHGVLRLHQGRARTPHQWLVLNGRANRLPWGNHSALIRARLDLPAPGRGC